jgi:transcriptional regulator with XRE-family HTH domain
MSTAQEKFGNNVKKLRQQRGWSQEDLAAASKIHRTYISGIELGTRNPSLGNIVKIAKAFRVKPGAFFED